MSFYQQRLDYLNNRIAALLTPSDTSANPPLSGQPGYDDDCLKAEAAKIQRVLGISPNAGLAQAIALCGSPGDACGFALPILADIGTPEAAAELQKLATAQNGQIPNIPQTLLSKLQRSGRPNQLGPAGFTSVPLSSVPSASK